MKPSVARLLLPLALLLMTARCAPESTGASSLGACTLPVEHHDSAFGRRLTSEWDRLGPGSASEQLAQEHVRLQDAAEGLCGHRIGG